MYLPPTAPPPGTSVRIDSVQVLPQIAPTIAIGEVLSMMVRDNPQNGQGRLYFRGQLIQATLPPTVQAGDRLLAKVTDSGAQIILKILDVQQPQNAQQPQVSGPRDQLATNLAREIKTALRASAPPTLTTSNPVHVDAQTPGNVERAVKQAQLPVEQLDTKTALAQLQAATNGSLVKNLRDAAQAIRTAIATPQAATQAAAEPQVSPALKTLGALKAELTSLLEGSPSTSELEIVKKLLEETEKVLTNEEKTSKADRPEAKKALEVLKEFKAALATQDSRDMGALKTALKEAAKGLPAPAEKHIANTDKRAADPADAATRLEQVATLQETLNQLNPVMQSIGQPALILFPFVLQGLLTHTEIAVDPNGSNKKKRGDSGGDDEDRPDTESFQRVQVSVPLPSLGAVDIDVAHRSDEILVRITSSDPEAAAFLTEQLGQLEALLRGQGFKSADLVSKVKVQSEPSPTWSRSLTAGSNFVA